MIFAFKMGKEAAVQASLKKQVNTARLKFDFQAEIQPGFKVISIYSMYNVLWRYFKVLFLTRWSGELD